MDLKTKKIISKEILILLLSITISLLCFLGTYGYNYYKVSQSKINENIILLKSKQIDTLSHSYTSKIENIRKLDGSKDFLQVEKILLQNIISIKEKKDYDSSMLIQKGVDSLKNENSNISNSLFSFQSQKRVGYISFILLLSLLFGLRYIYYLTKWCFKNLKE